MHPHRAWEEAYENLRAADADDPLAPADLERLAEAARWSLRFAETLDALERAQGSYEVAGQQRSAARLAIELAYMHWERADDVIAGAWLARAWRLLQGVGDCTEHGRLRPRPPTCCFAAGTWSRRLRSRARSSRRTTHRRSVPERARARRPGPYADRVGAGRRRIAPR